MAYNLNIIIPVYNEGELIVKTINEIEKCVKTSHNIIIVYDMDEDTSISSIKQSSIDTLNIKLVKNKFGRGGLNALKSGFDEIDAPVFIVLMADLADDITQIDKMYLILSEGFDVVCGSRYVRGGMQIGGGRLKKTLSRLAGISLHYLIGIPTHDISNSFKMYRSEVLRSIKLESSAGFEIMMELIIKAYLKGYKISEIPSTWKDRTSGDSRFDLRKWLKHYIKWYIYAIKGKYFGVQS